MILSLGQVVAFVGQLTLDLAKKEVHIEIMNKLPLANGKWGTEKTVDVNLAVDMVTLQKIYDLAIIVSGDQDYVPAAQAVKDMGKPVVNVAFNARNGKLLPGGARRLNHTTDWSIAMEWERFRTMLGISEPQSEESQVMSAAIVEA